MTHAREEGNWFGGFFDFYVSRYASELVYPYEDDLRVW